MVEKSTTETLSKWPLFSPSTHPPTQPPPLLKHSATVALPNLCNCANFHALITAVRSKNRIGCNNNNSNRTEPNWKLEFQWGHVPPGDAYIFFLIIIILNTAPTRRLLLLLLYLPQIKNFFFVCVCVFFSLSFAQKSGKNYQCRCVFTIFLLKIPPPCSNQPGDVGGCFLFISFFPPFLYIIRLLFYFHYYYYLLLAGRTGFLFSIH